MKTFEQLDESTQHSAIHYFTEALAYFFGTGSKQFASGSPEQARVDTARERGGKIRPRDRNNITEAVWECDREYFDKEGRARAERAVYLEPDELICRLSDL